MTDHSTIYKEEAQKYDLLISKQPMLLAEIQKIRAVEGLDAIDIGAGTGRLTTVLAPYVRSIIAIDASEAMLALTSEKLTRQTLFNWRTLVSDLRQLPIQDKSADLVTAGWSICYTANCDMPDWEASLAQTIQELKRVVRPGGTIIIFETMGTMSGQPNPPDFLVPYYEQLEKVYGFSHKWIRTDYSFDTVGQAAELIGFFFGEWCKDRVLERSLKVVPECCGIWWLHI